MPHSTSLNLFYFNKYCKLFFLFKLICIFNILQKLDHGNYKNLVPTLLGYNKIKPLYTSTIILATETFFQESLRFLHTAQNMFELSRNTCSLIILCSQMGVSILNNIYTPGGFYSEPVNTIKLAFPLCTSSFPLQGLLTEQIRAIYLNIDANY